MIFLRLILLALIGLVMGSFISALTYRLPRSISVFRGRSVCPKCKKLIAWYDNIPLLSYVILNGKCRSCGKLIPRRYPLIELATGLLFALIGFFFSSTLVTIYYLLITVLLIAIFVIDIEHQIIPDELVFIGLLATIIFLLLADQQPVYISLVSGFGSALFLLLINLITRGQGMGLGDVKLAIFLGAVAGWPKTVLWMFLSFVIGATVGLLLISLGKAHLKQRIAFGPFLVVAFFITLAVLS